MVFDCVTGDGVWLFDIDSDPTELHDLSATRLDVVQKLLSRISFFTNKSIVQDHGHKDPRSNPANFGGVWTPWLGDPDPAHCAAPPVPPPPPCDGDGSEGQADHLKLSSSSCAAQGWCSGAGFSGPPRIAEVAVDGHVVASGIADLHRAIAGNHGFTIPFECAPLATGQHNITISCKV